MRAIATDLIHALLSLPLYVLFTLFAASVVSWRAGAGARLYRWRFLFPALGVFVYLGSAPVVSAALASWIEQSVAVPEVTAEHRSADNVIVVLSAGWLRATPDDYEQKIGEAGWERTATAVALWRRIGGRLLFVGAPAPDGKRSAASAMARMAGEWGVPEQALRVESASTNTHENLLYAKQLLGPAPGRLWLVTSALHMPRSVGVAEAQGLRVIPYPCDFRADQAFRWQMFLPMNEGPLALEAALHELLGMVFYRLRGWI